MAGPKKKDAKCTKYKTVEERREVVERVKAAIAEQGLSVDLVPSLAEFYKILEDYCAEGLTCGYSGKMEVPELGRNLVYVLPCRKATKDAVWLEAAK